MKTVIIQNAMTLPLLYKEMIVARESELPVRVFLYGTFGTGLPDTTIIKEGVYVLELVCNKHAKGDWTIDRKSSAESVPPCPPPPMPNVGQCNIRDAEKPDMVNNPPHYNSSKATCDGCGTMIECIEVTRHMSFNIGNAVKYLWRFEHKGGLEDLKKAQWYLNDAIDKMESEND